MATTTPTSGAAVPGTYVALPVQARIVDTRIGGAGVPARAVPGGGDITPQVTGTAGVPATGVGSIVATVTAWSPTATGALTAFRYGSLRPGTTTLRFAKGQRAVTGTTIVPVASGRIDVHNAAGSGTVQITVDVSGYYRSGTASTSAPGVFHPVTPRRFVDTRTGLGGVPKARVAAGRSISARLGGRGGLPATPGVAAVTVTAVAPTRAGTVVAGRGGDALQGFGYVNFDAGETVSAFVPARLAGGVARIGNNSAGTVDLVVDVVGYWTSGSTGQAGAYRATAQTRAPEVYLTGGGNVTVELGGQGGVPRSGVAAVVATLHALAPRDDMFIQAFRPGQDSPPAGAVLQYSPGKTDAGVVVLPATDDGSVMLRNPSPKAMRVAIDIDGWVPATSGTAR